MTTALPETIVVPLASRLDLGGDRFLDRVVLRAPRLREYARLGEPIIFVPDANGNDVPIEVDEVIEKYLATLVIEPDIPAQLFNLRLDDSIRVKEALLSFFLESRERALRTPPASSSSTSGSFDRPNGTI